MSISMLMSVSMHMSVWRSLLAMTDDLFDGRRQPEADRVGLPREATQLARAEQRALGEATRGVGDVAAALCRLTALGAVEDAADPEGDA